MESQDYSLGFNINNSSLKDNNSISLVEIDSGTSDTIEFKIILLGNTAVGKTSIFNRFITSEFSQNYKSTITAECKSKLIKIDKNLLAKLVIWDTCGSEIYRAVTSQYYRGAHGAIIVFDLTDQSTFNGLKKWIKDLKNYGEKDTEMIIVGNKLDLIGQRKVTQSQAMNYCRENNYKYIEASAKDGTNILKIFEELTFDLAEKHKKQREKEINKKYMVKALENKDLIDLEKKNKGCC